MTGRHSRSRALTFAAGLLLCLVALEPTYYLQVVAAADYKARAERQQIREVSVPAKRGDIQDRDGTQLAVSQRMATVRQPPFDRRPTDHCGGPLGRARLEGKRLALTRQENRGFVYIARKIDPALGAKVKLLLLPGVDVSSEDKRIYPLGALAPQLLGYVGMDNIGLDGLEKEYDGLLSGTAGTREIVQDSSGRSVKILSEQESQQGSTLTLTIDADIQYATEQVLAAL